MVESSDDEVIRAPRDVVGKVGIGKVVLVKLNAMLDFVVELGNKAVPMADEVSSEGTQVPGK